jgi:hypothetical protein
MIPNTISAYDHVNKAGMSHSFFYLEFLLLQPSDSHCCVILKVRYTLGHVFDKDYTGQDRSKPYIDHIAIRRELVPQYAKDGLLQISIELDVQVLPLSIISYANALL